MGGETEEGDRAPGAWRPAIGMGGIGGRPVSKTKKEKERLAWYREAERGV